MPPSNPQGQAAKNASCLWTKNIGLLLTKAQLLTTEVRHPGHKSGTNNKYRYKCIGTRLHSVDYFGIIKGSNLEQPTIGS